jgi:serine/threonine protein kinase
MGSAEPKIGKFQVRRRIGRGGMGAVYEGYDPALDRRVAIKTLTTDAIADRESRGRFEREARAAAKLQHPNIVTVYELGNFGGTEKPYIVMELLEGTDLAGLIESERALPLAEALEITIQLCQALGFAHEKGVVHRDMKPSNVRYLDDGRVKIMDFGIARVEGSAPITRSGVMVGTLHYMSPEQIKGEPTDGRSDLFSTGCILFEMLTGKRPFQGESATSILYKIVNEPVPPILKEHPDLPQEVQEILGRALAKQPGERFRTASEMAHELEKLLEIYRKTLPRPSAELQARLNELEELRREERWVDIVPLAKKVIDARPELTKPHKALRAALRELNREEAERRMPPDERTRQLAELSREFELLYGAPSAPAGAATARDLRLPGRDEPTGAVRHRRPFVLPAVLGVLVAGLGVGGWFFLPRFMGPREISHTIRISSEPPGAAIFVNGLDTGRVTSADATVELPIRGYPEDKIALELRRDGFSPATATFSLDADPPPPLDLRLESLARTLVVTSDPPGAWVEIDGARLEGVTPVELEISPGDHHELVVGKSGYTARTFAIDPDGELPSEVIALAAIGKPGTLRVRSDYPVALRSEGRALASASNAPTIELMAGRSVVTLYAPEVFLNRSVSVDIAEEEMTTIQAPPLGRFSVRAFPGNCTLTVDGITSEAPPFDNKPIIVGRHTFVFEWPDGQKRTYEEEVVAGEPKYLIGRR